MRTKFQPSVGFSVANFFAQLKFARGHDVCVSTAFFDVVEIDVAFFIFLLVLERSVASQVFSTSVTA